MELTSEQRKQVLSDMADARKRKMAGRALIDSAFPMQGTPMGAHQGSQSMSPSKAPDNYPATTGPDPGDYMQ